MNGQGADLRHDKAFFGREEELIMLVRNLQRGRHTLIVGEKGIGKSRLMKEANWIFAGNARRIDLSSKLMPREGNRLFDRLKADQYKILYVEHPAPLGDCMKEIAEKLFNNGDLSVDAGEEISDWRAVKRTLSGIGGMKTQSLIFESISGSSRPYLLFFDELDRISPAQQKFIETLLSIAVICAAVVQMKENYHFKRIWASFSRINLEPLPENVSAEMVNYIFREYPLHVIDAELYRREILKASNGNPFHIKNMLWHGSRERYLDAGEIRKLRQRVEGRYFNMGPIYIFGIAMFTLFKIFSIGTDNQEFYIYFSALGFFAYLVFRVFRAFFLFRPQKY